MIHNCTYSFKECCRNQIPIYLAQIWFWILTCSFCWVPWPHKTLVVYCWGPNHRSREWLWYNFVLIWKNVCLLSHDWLPAHCALSWSWGPEPANQETLSELLTNESSEMMIPIIPSSPYSATNSSQLHCKQLFVFTNCNYAQPLSRI